MSALPTTRQGLAAADYRFAGIGACRSCGAPIEWFDTPPKRRDGQIKPTRAKMPMTVTVDKNTNTEVITPHWGDCPTREAHRKARQAYEDRGRKPEPVQGKLL